MAVLGQIRIWLMQLDEWSFLSFASTVIGLVCYAFSSPFNHLFKKWNFFKIVFYSVISFIICLIVLFAKVWQRLRSQLVNAYLTVMIFTGSSVYSFFFEKALKEKSDVYSLVSCAAFAIMSFSLSRQRHCGFEVDLLNFFLTCLFILLAKIHLLLAIFGGGGFACCLTMLRYSLEAQQEDVDLEQGLVGDSQQANTGSPLHTIRQQASTDSAAIMTFDAPPQNEYLELQDDGVTQVDSHSQPPNTGSPLLTIPQQANTDSAPLMTFDAPPQNEYTEPITVVMKLNMHCDGCASKIIRSLRRFQGVETVKAAGDTGKITVTGNVDPTNVRDKLEEKVKRKVDLFGVGFIIY